MDEQQLETALALYCSAVPIVQWSTNKSLGRQMIWRKLMRSSALNCIYLTSQLRNPIEPTQMLEQVWLCHGHFYKVYLAIDQAGHGSTTFGPISIPFSQAKQFLSMARMPLLRQPCEPTILRVVFIFILQIEAK